MSITGSSGEDDLIRLAFEMPEKPGLTVLLRLGALDVWRGNVAEFRRDEGETRPAIEDAVTEAHAQRAAELFDVLLMRRALSSLDSRCREILRLRYAYNRDGAEIASLEGLSRGNVDDAIRACRAKAYSKFEELRSDDPRTVFVDIAAIPSETEPEFTVSERLRKTIA